MMDEEERVLIDEEKWLDMSGKFIVIEGLDASGKGTQAERLVEDFQESDGEVKYVNFPRYDTDFGSLVGKYLRGEFGDREEIPVEIRCMLYAMDRYQFKEEFNRFLEEGGVIVSDRYTQSNLGYQTADFEGGKKREMIKWIEDVERRLPQPDLVLFLDVTPEIAYGLHESKDEREYIGGSERDIQEKDIELQRKVYRTYDELTEERENWIRVDCVEGKEIKSIENIHNKVKKIVEDYL